MKKLSIQKATDTLAEYVRTLKGEPLAITEGGKPIAVLIPVERIDLETLAVGTNPDFVDLIEQSRRQFQNGSSVSFEDLRRQLSIPMPGEYKRPAKKHKSKTKQKVRGAADGRKV